MNAKEKVRVLRVRAEYENKRGYSGESSELTELADLIESQSTEIDHLSKALADWKYEAGCEHDMHLACMRENEELRANLAENESMHRIGVNAGADAIKQLKVQLAESQRRERAAVEDLANEMACGVCTYLSCDVNDDPCASCGHEHSNFVWRGPVGGREETR